MLALEAMHATGDATAFATAYRAALVRVQNSLAAPGFAPVASVAAANADRARRHFIDGLTARRSPAHA
jgi:hypothetical protein